jgi:hypothetical protein
MIRWNWKGKTRCGNSVTDLILRNYSPVLYFILRLCNDVALCPLDMKSWLPADSLEGIPCIFILIYVVPCIH